MIQHNKMYDDVCQSMYSVDGANEGEKRDCAKTIIELLHAKVRKEQGKLAEKKSKEN